MEKYTYIGDLAKDWTETDHKHIWHSKELGKYTFSNEAEMFESLHDTFEDTLRAFKAYGYWLNHGAMTVAVPENVKVFNYKTKEQIVVDKIAICAQAHRLVLSAYLWVGDSVSKHFVQKIESTNSGTGFVLSVSDKMEEDPDNMTFAHLDLK